jgi:hypothetical protein
MEDEVRKGWRDAELLALFRDICENFAPESTSEGPDLIEVSPMTQSLEAMRRQLRD